MTGNWDLLPMEVYVQIFTELHISDRINASSVCKSWYRCFNAPQLWQKVKVKFKTTEDKRYKQFALKYGEYFRSIHLQCYQQSEDNCRNLCRFLEILYSKENLKIEDIKIELCEQNPLFYSGDAFSHHLKQLFVSTNNIRKIDLSKFSVVINDNLLKAITQNHGSSIESLNINNKTLVCGLSSNSLLDFVKEAKHLQYLYVQSSCFSNDALKILAEGKRTQLKFLSLNFKRADKFFKAIKSESWQKTRNELPGLRIELHFDHSYPLESTYKIMVPDVPVSILKLRLHATVASHINLASNLYKNTLETLEVTSTPSPDFDDAILRLVKECSSLKDIHVWCRMAQEVVTAIHNHKSLRKYTLAFVDTMHEEIIE